MRRLRLRYQESAAADPQDIYLYLVSQGASARAARDYVLRIRETCVGIGDAPEGGRPRDDLAPGLRTWSFEKRAVIGYRLEPDAVVSEQVFYGGRDVEGSYAGRRGTLEGKRP